MKNFIGIIIVAMMASCSPKIIQTTKTVEKDSVHVDSVKTTKIIKTKGDSVGMSFKLPEGQIVYPESNVKEPKEELSFPSEDPIVFKKTQKQGRLTESVTISKKGNVVITCKEDSLQHVIDEMKVTIQKFKNTTTTETKVEVCPPKSGFTKFCEWFTITILVVLVGVGAYKIRKVIPV